MLHRRSVTFALVLGLTGMLSLAGRNAIAQEQPPVRIGFAIAKTGLFAAATPAQVNAYHFWRDQVNEKGGLNVEGVKRKIEFVEYDDQSNTANAVKIYEKLITDDKVDLLLSPWVRQAISPSCRCWSDIGFPVIGSTASSVHIRELKKAKNMWFVSPSVHDKLAIKLTQMAKDQKVKCRHHRQHVAAGQGDQALPRSGAGSGRHQDRGERGISAGHQGHDGTAEPGQGVKS